MSKKTRYVIFTIVATIFWVASDLFLIVGFFQLSHFGYETNRSWLSFVNFLFFFTPVIPLGFVLFFSSKIGMTVARMLAGFTAIVILLFVFPVFLFFTEQPTISSTIPAFVIFGMWVAVATVFLFFQLLSGLLFLKLQKKSLGIMPQRFFRTYILGLSVYLVFVILLVVLMVNYEHANQDSFCSGERYAGGRFSRVYFLEPITKSEVAKIVKENSFKIDHIMLASKGDMDNPLDFQIYPPLDLLAVGQKLESSFDFRALPQSLKNQYSLLFQAYEAGESVVWSVGFKDVPMDVMTKFVYQLDVEDGQLGAVDRAFADNPRDIQPVTDRLVVDQADCYKKLKLKAR